MDPPRNARSVTLEPKYPTFNSDDGYCTRMDLMGCITTVREGENVTEGESISFRHNVLVFGKFSSLPLGKIVNKCTTLLLKCFLIFSHLIVSFSLIVLTEVLHCKPV